MTIWIPLNECKLIIKNIYIKKFNNYKKIKYKLIKKLNLWILI